MPRTRDQMVTELQDLGHGYLTAARLQAFVLDAAKDVFYGERWRVRYQEAQITPGQPVPLLGAVSQVLLADGTVLDPVARDDARDSGLALETGSPPRAYSIGPGLTDILRLYPTQAATATVCFYSKACWQDTSGSLTTKIEATDGDDVLLGSTGDFDEVVLLGARARCLEDTDEQGLRDGVLARMHDKLARLRDTELDPDSDEPPFIKVTQDWI